MKQEYKLALQEINFFERVKEIAVKSYKIDSENILESYSKEEVCKIFIDLGYEVRYDKKEKFYEIIIKINKYSLICNIAIENDYLDIGWYLYYENEFYEGDVWQMLSYDIDENYEEFMKPEYHNYKELAFLIEKVMLLFEDFKTVLAKSLMS